MARSIAYILSEHWKLQTNLNSHTPREWIGCRLVQEERITCLEVFCVKEKAVLRDGMKI